MRVINWFKKDTWLIAFWVGIAVVLLGMVLGQLWIGIVGVTIAMISYYKLPNKFV